MDDVRLEFDNPAVQGDDGVFGGQFDTSTDPTQTEDACTNCNEANDKTKSRGYYPKLFGFDDAPEYLKFNPFIRSGYRGILSTKLCVESIFWWTNETVNIWSHLFGFVLFFSLTVYDMFCITVHASFKDMAIVAGLLFCFQICMVLSSIYHTFSCKSESDYHNLLCFDLFGIALSLLSIYISGIYYAFYCIKHLQYFYMISVSLVFVVAIILQKPSLNIDSNIKLAVFVAWAAYGGIPTFHWTIVEGGLANPMVNLLLPRVLGMYFIVTLAFLIYVTKVPERWFPGKVDFIGSSHQWWHTFVVLALYYWHNTGMLYIEYRMNHTCANNVQLFR